ncbi:MAG: methyltransferase regulatory domain-containing protein [Anaerolineae bacterium]|nr:methyltransferase regulatory domain-containing protein [Anaerolineae bacterium]
MQTSYDVVPYPGHSYNFTHPDNLATLATLLGMSPTPVDTCRVLELGCANGANLLPMAESLPGSTFVGIDASQRQIVEGQAIVDALEMKNLTLLPMDIMEDMSALGQFDYIIAHGVYSWVPTAVRDKVMAICKQHLAPQGVAYISYNTYPGSLMLDLIREAMLYRARGFAAPQERVAQARVILDFLAEGVDKTELYGQFLGANVAFLKKALEEVGPQADNYLLHDQLEEINQPFYFHQFAAHAEQHGLQYLVESEFRKVLGIDFPQTVQQGLQVVSNSVIDREQYMDFLRNTMFRQSLLCHNDVVIQRALTPEHVYPFYMASRGRYEVDTLNLDVGAVMNFQCPDGANFSTDHPVTKAALTYLIEVWPRAIPFSELYRVARTRVGLSLTPDVDPVGWAEDIYALSGNLLHIYTHSHQLVELHSYTPAVSSEVSTWPVASPLVRLWARREAVVTNMWHERVYLDDFKRYLLLGLDGTRDHDALLGHFVDLARDGRVGVSFEGKPVADEVYLRDILSRNLEQHLFGLAKTALLVG